MLQVKLGHGKSNLYNIRQEKKGMCVHIIKEAGYRGSVQRINICQGRILEKKEAERFVHDVQLNEEEQQKQRRPALYLCIKHDEKPCRLKHHCYEQ
jgi:hypothetical protein